MDGCTLEVVRSWNADLYETYDVTLDQAYSAVVIWTETDNVDDGPSPQLARLLAEGMASLGPVAFRAFEPAVRPRWIGKIGSKREGWNIISCQQPADIAELFEVGWSMQSQAAIIGATEDRAFDLLSETWWREQRLCAGEIAIAPIVDGDGMMIAASTELECAHAIHAILHPAVEHGYGLIRAH